MPIYTVDDLRRTAPAGMEDASPEELVRQYANETGQSFETVADYLGVKPSGTLYEMGRQAGAGAVVDLPRMVGQGLKYTGVAPEFGQELVQGAEERAYQWEPDLRGRGFLGRAGVLGARGLAPMAPAIAAGFIPGGQFVAPAVAGTLFGTSAAQDTYERVLAETGDEQAASDAAARAGLLQGPGEAAATAVGLRALKPLGTALRGTKTTGQVAAGLTTRSAAKDFAKAYGANLVVQPGTEIIQDVGTSLIEEAYGASPQDLAAIAEYSGTAGFGMAMLLGGFAAPTSMQRARQAAKLREDLTSEDAETRKKATDYVAKVARVQGVDDADIGAWVSARLEEEKANATKMRAEEEQNLLALEAPAQPLGLGYTPPAPPDLSQPIVAGYTPTEGQGELFGFGGEAPPVATGEQLDMLGEPTAAPQESGIGVREAQALAYEAQGRADLAEQVRAGAPADTAIQPDLFTQEPAYQTRITADTLKAADLNPRSRYYRQLIGKDMADPAQQQEIGILFQRLLDDKNISQGTKDAVDNLRMQAFGGLAQQRSMVGPRGGALPQGRVIQEQQAPQPVQPLPTAPLGEAAGPGVAEVSAREAAAQEAAAAEAAQQAAEQEAARPMPTLTAQEQKIIDGIDNVLAANPEEGERQAMQAMRDRVVIRARAREEQAVQSNIPVATTAAPAAKPTATDNMSSSERAELADTLSNLEARVASEGGRVKGKISLPKSVLGGLARMIRSTKTMPPIAYVPKSASEVDEQATQQYGEQMGSIRDAAKSVVEAAKKLFDYEASIIPSESKAALQIPGAAPMSDAQKEKRAFKIADDTVAEITKRRAQLANAVENLRSVAGSDINVEAVIAVTKGAIQKGQQKSQAAAKAKAERSTDALLSTAWRRFKDGSLAKAEEADVTRGTEQRLSRESEARGAEEQPIVSAVEEGYARRPYKDVKIRKGESTADFNKRQQKSIEAWENSKEKGVAGALAYIQRHGTAFERLISASIGRALRNPKLKNAQPGVVWISEGEKPYYDPKKNVVGVHRKASPEELMHESLHAALQWFVYSNPESYEVRSLLNALDKVLSYKGDIPAKAQEVIDVLRTVSKGRSKTARLDAVLELVSYGTTLSDFRNFLKTMESGQIANEGLMSGMSALWKRITALVQRMLGVSNTVANDVLDGTVALLESAAMEAAVPTKRSGSKLYSGAKKAVEKWFAGVRERMTPERKGKSKLVSMPIDQFLDLAEKDTPRADKVARVDSIIAADGKFSAPPYLSIYVDEAGKAVVNGHEGRHRARALKKLGYTHMPVELKTNIRWSEQADPESFDYRENWPTTLTGENGNVIRFPVSRAQAMDEYTPAAATSAAGERLYATVASDSSMPKSPNAAASGPFSTEMSNEELAKFSKGLLPKLNFTQAAFNLLGWSKGMQWVDEKVATPVSKFIQKETPAVAQAVSWVNSHFGLDAPVRDILIRAKDDSRSGSIVYEKIADYVKSLPNARAAEFLEYMNKRLDYLRGQKPEPSAKGYDPLMTQLADAAINNWFKYATEGGLSAKDMAKFVGVKAGKRWIGGMRFTEGFVFPTRVGQIASGNFGSRGIGKLSKTRTKDEVNLDAIRTRVNNDGDQILTDKFIGVYKMTPKVAELAANNRLHEMQPDEFISADLYAAQGIEKGYIVDPVFDWELQTKGKKGYKLTARMDAAKAKNIKTTQELADAFQNTMSLLASSYASNRMATSLYNDFGLNSRGERDASAIAFDSLDQLNTAINSTGVGENFKANTDRDTWARRITSDKIVDLGKQGEAKAGPVQKLFRNRNQWVRIPNTPSVYGPLAGKIVNGSVWAAILDSNNSRPVIDIPFMNKVMAFHKASKTKYNPATWGTNVATNFTFALVDDIPLSQIPHAARLYIGAMMTDAQRAKYPMFKLSPQEMDLITKVLNTNALLGTFASEEIKASIYQSFKSNLEGPERNIMSRLMQFAKVDQNRTETLERLAASAKDKAKRMDELSTEWYSMQDNIFRVASMLNQLGQKAAMNKNLTEEDFRLAGDHAREAFLDYDIDAKAIKIMRQTAFPFISWPYAATKLLGKTIVTKPWKLVNLYVGYAILDAMMASAAGGDDDELRKAGPEYMREKLLFGMGPNAYIRIPFMGDSDNPVYYHLGKYMFTSSLLDTSPNGFMGQDWWPSAITPTGPFITGITALVGNVDTFTGRPISSETDTNLEALGKRVSYMQGQFAPNLPFVNAQETTKFLDAMQGRLDQPENASMLKMARYMGLRMYNYNVDSALAQQDRAAKAIEKQYKMEIAKLKRKQLLLEDPDWDTFFERQDELMKRLEERLAELRGEEE